VRALDRGFEELEEVLKAWQGLEEEKIRKRDVVIVAGIKYRDFDN